jgi:hypothetical protein
VTHRARIAIATLAAAMAIGCSTSDTAAPADAGDDTASSRDGASNCVKPGTPSNDAGVGAYCDKASDCTGSFCTGLFGAPESEWFCTRLCKTDGECGGGAYCAHDSRGAGCVPLTCGEAPDASADAPPDAPLEADRPQDASDGAAD